MLFFGIAFRITIYCIDVLLVDLINVQLVVSIVLGYFFIGLIHYFGFTSEFMINDYSPNDSIGRNTIFWIEYSIYSFLLMYWSLKRNIWNADFQSENPHPEILDDIDLD